MMKMTMMLLLLLLMMIINKNYDTFRESMSTYIIGLNDADYRNKATDDDGRS